MEVILVMNTIEVSDCTEERLDVLKRELYGGDIETDTMLFLLSDEILEE